MNAAKIYNFIYIFMTKQERDEWIDIISKAIIRAVIILVTFTVVIFSIIKIFFQLVFGVSP